MHPEDKETLNKYEELLIYPLKTLFITKLRDSLGFKMHSSKEHNEIRIKCLSHLGIIIELV